MHRIRGTGLPTVMALQKLSQRGALRLLQFGAVLVLGGCAAGMDDRSDSLSRYEIHEAVVAVLAVRQEESPRYCLRVLGRAPTAPLRRRLHLIGQDPTHCRRDHYVYRITGVRALANGRIAVDMLEDGGPLDTWGGRDYLKRDKDGKLRIVESVLTREP